MINETTFMAERMNNKALVDSLVVISHIAMLRRVLRVEKLRIPKMYLTLTIMSNERNRKDSL